MSDQIAFNPKLKQQIENILEVDEAARNSDAVLVWRVWQKHHGLRDSMIMDQFIAFTSYDDITRKRREIQNTEKKFLPSLEVWKARGMNEFDYWQYYKPVAKGQLSMVEKPKATIL